LTDAIALSATPNSVVAQESTSRPTPPPPGLQGIDLTEQQQEQITQISQDFRSQMQAILPAPPELTTEQKAKLQQLEQSYREQVEAILKPEQQQQFRQNLEQLRQRKPGNSPRGS